MLQPAPAVRQHARIGRYAGSPVVGFVKTVPPQPPQQRLASDSSAALRERASLWLESINARRMADADELTAPEATYHDDGMFLLQPANGRTAIRKVWRDWLRSVPDYQIEAMQVAAEPATHDAFIMWRAGGVAQLPLIPHRPTTNKPFEHYGVTRLHFDPDTGLISDQWTWRGASADEAKWLLSRSYKQCDCAAFIGGDDGRGGGGVATEGDSAAAARARSKGAALLFREVFGAVPGADVQQLDAALSEDYMCKEATGVWRSLNLGSREECLNYSLQRQQQLSGSPHWHSEAITPDGRMLFVHFQNVLTNKSSRTLVGLSSGILVHAFDAEQRIRRTLMFRGPMSLSERAEFFHMDCRPSTQSQADKQMRTGGVAL